MKEAENRFEITKRVGLFGIIGNIFLLSIKAIVGFSTKSQAMIADSINSAGDIFASIIAADAVNGVNFHESVRKASTFIKKCILKAIEMDIPLTDGVPFEELLTTLK